MGDTSIFGWMVMVLKSAKVAGITVPEESRTGAMRYLERVADGPNRGLARYQPGPNWTPTPTMTAEAWASRQFLGVGGPGPASREAGAFLLRNARGPASSTSITGITAPWPCSRMRPGVETWNTRVRDELVRRQWKRDGQAGSWDPDDSQYGKLGGRLYTTTLATLTLEVYYRYLRMYESAEPSPSVTARRAPAR